MQSTRQLLATAANSVKVKADLVNLGPLLFVPEVGLEPTRPFEQSILSAPRLPFRHSGKGTVLVYPTTKSNKV